MKICDICKENVKELTDIYLISNEYNRQDCCLECFEKFKEPNWFEFRYTFYPFREFTKDGDVAKNSLETSIFWKNFPSFSDIAHEEYNDYYYTKKAQKKTDKECKDVTKEHIEMRKKLLWEKTKDSYHPRKIVNYGKNPKGERNTLFSEGDAKLYGLEMENKYEENIMQIRFDRFSVHVRWGDVNDEYQQVDIPENFYVEYKIWGMLYPNEDLSNFTEMLRKEFAKLRLDSQKLFDKIKCYELKEYAVAGASKRYDEKEEIEEKLRSMLGNAIKNIEHDRQQI